MATLYPHKIIALWVVFLLGTLFHTQLGLMPLFHGLNVTVEPLPSLDHVIPILWGMLGFFAIPMGAIVVTLFTDAYRYRVFHFWLTIVYTLLNLGHVMADLVVPPRVWPQITLMVILFVVGLLLNWVSLQWMRDRQRLVSQ